MPWEYDHLIFFFFKIKMKCKEKEGKTKKKSVVEMFDIYFYFANHVNRMSTSSTSKNKTTHSS